MIHLKFGYCWQAFLVNYILHLQIAIATYVIKTKKKIPTMNQNWYSTLLLEKMENESWDFCLNTVRDLAKKVENSSKSEE